jgi:Lar family restriction alleviation protein
MTDKLLPCPFCGGSDVKLRNDPRHDMAWVSCVGCGLEAPTETGVTDEAAVTYWNRRAPSPETNLRVDVDRLAASIVTAACELDGPAAPAGDDTISITMEDLEAVVHRHITTALEAQS